MRRTIRSRAVALVAVSVLALSTAACGDNKKLSDESSASPSDSISRRGMVGASCAAYAKKVPDGAGSFNQMAKDLVVTAVGNNPLLTTFAEAVGGTMNKDVNLTSTLNDDAYTVFAPVDEAFDKLPADTVKALGTPQGAKTLEKILRYHVVKGEIAPSDLAGKRKNLDGKKLTVTGAGDSLTVNGNAGVVCGGIKTKNATVYLIDTVLIPPND